MLGDEEYIISNTQRVVTHANFNDSVTHWALNLRDGGNGNLKRQDMTNLMKNEYRYNSNFRKFVDEYCNNNRCTVDEAFCSEEIKKMFWIYTEL